MPAGTVTTASSQVIPASSTSTVLQLENNSDQDIYYRLGNSVSPSGDSLGFILRANGGKFATSGAPSRLAVYAMHGGSGAKILTYDRLHV